MKKKGEGVKKKTMDAAERQVSSQENLGRNIRQAYVVGGGGGRDSAFLPYPTG